MTPTSETDVIVIGAGHNSLICAAYLSKAGLTVRIVEASEEIGGGTATSELTLPGFRHDPFSTGHFGLMANPAWSDGELPLAMHGLRYVAPDPVVVLPLEDGDTITLWHDQRRTAAELARFSSHDAQAWHQLCRDWAQIEPTYFDMVSNAPAAPDKAAVVSRIKSGVNRARKVLGAMSPVKAALMGLLANRSAMQVIAERFEHPNVRKLMLWLVGAIGQPLDQNGTGMMAIAVPGLWGKYGWVHPIGGSRALPDSLASILKEAGVDVLTGAKVSEILVESGRARGVRTADGRTYLASRAVVSSAHATDLPGMLPDFVLPTSFSAALAKWEGGPSAFNVHLAVERNHRIKSRWGSISPVLTGSITESGIAAQLADISAERLSGDGLWLLAACSSIADPSRAPAGKGVIKLTTMAPYALAGDPGNWETAKSDYADQLVAMYAELVEDFRPGDELGRAVMAPPDILSANSSFFGGSPQGGALSPAQSGANRPASGWASYRMPLPGLYQTGLSTHPGGAVTGWPGRNAAKAVLDDLQISRAGILQDTVENY